MQNLCYDERAPCRGPDLLRCIYSPIYYIVYIYIWCEDRIVVRQSAVVAASGIWREEKLDFLNKLETSSMAHGSWIESLNHPLRRRNKKTGPRGVDTPTIPATKTSYRPTANSTQDSSCGLSRNWILEVSAIFASRLVLPLRHHHAWYVYRITSYHIMSCHVIMYHTMIGCLLGSGLCFCSC